MRKINEEVDPFTPTNHQKCGDITRDIDDESPMELLPCDRDEIINKFDSLVEQHHLVNIDNLLNSLDMHASHEYQISDNMWVLTDRKIDGLYGV